MRLSRDGRACCSYNSGSGVDGGPTRFLPPCGSAWGRKVRDFRIAETKVLARWRYVRHNGVTLGDMTLKLRIIYINEFKHAWGEVVNQRKERLLEILRETSSWVSGSFLAKSLGVSERTVRTYVSQLSETYRIESSKLGYRLADVAEAAPAREEEVADLASSRAAHVLSRLLSTTRSISLFSLADEMGIGESTLANSVLPAARREARAHDLELTNHNWELTLEGSERAKRRLLGHVVTSEAYGYFSSKRTLAKMFPQVDTDKIMRELVSICQESGLFLNAYALNNLLIHVLIILIRLNSGNELESSSETAIAHNFIENAPQRQQAVGVAEKISATFERTFGCKVPARDLDQIVLYISLSTNPTAKGSLTTEDVATFVGDAFLENVRRFLAEIAHRYGLPAFGEDFVAQLTLHSYNAYERALFGAQCPNPIGQQIKQEYPLIYDMAASYVHKLQSVYDVVLTEDEIAFIAFHIGAYIETTKEPERRITTIIVTERYHDFAERLAQEVKRNFPEELELVGTYSYDDFLLAPKACDLLITTVETPIHHPCQVVVSPILGRRGIARIRRAVERVKEWRQRERASIFLKDLIKPDLYVRNLACDSAESCIDSLGALVVRNGYADEAFVEDVKLRERVSTTAFTNFLAVPHAISKSAKRSFICTLHNDAPMSWHADRKVNIVLMIGLTSEDMKNFSQAFDIIIDRFTNPETAMRVLGSNTYEEFVETLIGSAKEGE